MQGKLPYTSSVPPEGTFSSITDMDWLLSNMQKDLDKNAVKRQLRNDASAVADKSKETVQSAKPAKDTTLLAEQIFNKI